jgi:hypothetical protein
MTEQPTNATEPIRAHDGYTQSGGPSDSGSHSTAPFANAKIGDATGGAAKPIDATKPIEVAKPFETAKPFEAAKPIEAAKPVEAAKADDKSRQSNDARPQTANATNAGETKLPSGATAPVTEEPRVQGYVSKLSTPVSTATPRTHPNQRMTTPSSESVDASMELALKPTAMPKAGGTAP